MRIQESDTSREMSIKRVILSYSQIGYKKISIKKPYFKREKPKKRTKHQRTERHDIKGVITKAKLKNCYVRIIEIVNERKDIEVQLEIIVPYDCFIKLSFFIISIYLIIYIDINFYWGQERTIYLFIYTYTCIILHSLI